MPAILLSPLARWAAVALVIAGLAGYILILRSDLRAASAEVREKANALRFMTEDRDRQAVSVKQLSDINQDQALQLTRLQVDADKAAIVAQQVEQDRQTELAKLRDTITDLKEKARANPDQVRPLGPIVRDALRAEK